MKQQDQLVDPAHQEMITHNWPKEQKVPTEVPIGNIGYDNIAHWPEFRPAKNKCHTAKWELVEFTARNGTYAYV